MKSFDVLFKKDSKGRLQSWEVWVTSDGGVGYIHQRHGKVGGKLQESKEGIGEGKNAGRANATTAVEQALAEAQSRWNKQVSRKGYTPDRAKAEAGGNDQAGFVSPMLAHRYDKYGEKKAVFPGFAQRKYDGLRCLCVIQDGDVSFWSRERKPIGLGLQYLASEIARLFPEGTHYLDGEFYDHDLILANNFEQIVSFVKDTEPQVGNEAVRYVVYDCASPGVAELPFTNRLQFLFSNLVVGASRSDSVQLAETVEVADADGFDRAIEGWLEEGYEGGMFRNVAGPYKPGPSRSYDLLKWKPLYDSKQSNEEEFRIVAAFPGRGKFAKCATFRCETKDGKKFKCAAPGTLEERARYLTNPELWQDKMLTVKFDKLTKMGVPRFPTAVRVREPGL